MRGWFAGQGFTEIEPGHMQLSPGNEAHLSAFASDFIALSGERHRLYLHTSPEFAAKKLMAAGEERIVAFARCFRNREASALHAPEFTMLEWYRASPAGRTDRRLRRTDAPGGRKRPGSMSSSSGAWPAIRSRRWIRSA